MMNIIIHSGRNHQMQTPCIFLLNDFPLGAGANLALFCDFKLATESAVFSQAFVYIGLIPNTAGTYYLQKNLNRKQADYYAFTGKKIDAKEAKNIGFITKLFLRCRISRKIYGNIGEFV